MVTAFSSSCDSPNGVYSGGSLESCFVLDLNAPGVIPTRLENTFDSWDELRKPDCTATEYCFSLVEVSSRLASAILSSASVLAMGAYSNEKVSLYASRA